MDDARDNGPVPAPVNRTHALPGKRRVEFALRCRCGARAAYVALADEAARPLAFEPMAPCGGVWRRSLRLAPGTYRYRYYVSDGQSMAYFDPSDAGANGPPVRMDGMDAVLNVTAPAPRPRRRFHRGAPCGSLYDDGRPCRHAPGYEHAPPAAGDDQVL